MANHQDNVVSIGDNAHEHSKTLSAKLIRQTRKLLKSTAAGLIGSFYEKLDDDAFEEALFERAGPSASVQQLFYETKQTLSKQQQAYSINFVSQVLKTYDQFWDLPSKKNTADSNATLDFNEDDLTLVDALDLEEDLALDGVIAKGMRLFSKEVYALNQRFAAIKGIEELSEEQNPVAPAALCQAFPVSINAVDIDLRIKLVIYKLFEQEVVQYFGALYDEINDLLKQAGVLPKLPSRVKKNPTSPAVAQGKVITEEPLETDSAKETQQVTGASTKEPEPDQGQVVAFDALRDMLKNQRPQPSAEQANLPKVEANDLVSTLSGMQFSNDSVSTEKSLQDISNEIKHFRDKLGNSLGTAGDGATRAYAGMDEDTIDVISMLFEFILEDTNLPDAMKALLSRLQIPMLKVAILDRQFFANKQHPARRLLNLLAKSAVGWVDDGDRSENSFYNKISSIVMRVLDDFREDLTLFESLYTEFNQFINKEEQGAEVIEERITEVTKGKEKMKLAQIRVAEVINSRAKAATVLPDVVKELLSDGWKDALTLAFLRHGEESEKWLKLVGLVDKLLWSVQPKTEVTERQRLLKAIPELLKSLRSELVEISYDQHKLGVTLKQLQVCHIHALKGGKQPENTVEETKAQPETSQSEIAQEKDVKNADLSGNNASNPDEHDQASATTENQLGKKVKVRHNLIESPLVADKQDPGKQMDEFDQQAKDLSVGTWLEWQDAQDNRVRGKLSWKSAITGTLVFVGRKGTKLAELTQTELAELFRLNKAVPLSDVGQPLLDRAMNSMASSLQSADQQA